jgi:hypothetical protein
MWEPRSLTTLWASTACYRIVTFYLFTFYRKPSLSVCVGLLSIGWNRLTSTSSIPISNILLIQHSSSVDQGGYRSGNLRLANNTFCLTVALSTLLNQNFRDMSPNKNFGLGGLKQLESSKGKFEWNKSYKSYFNNLCNV